MNLDFAFFFLSISLGVGLAMDAFSVSLANGLNEPCMKRGKMAFVAGIFAFFQFAMPLIGWVCIHTVATYFKAFEKCIPWIALLLLGFIGGKMIYESLTDKCEDDSCPCKNIGIAALLLQGVATSIDALSVGVTNSHYTLNEALISCLLIGGVTFLICFIGLAIGKRAGTSLADKAGILGGAILIFIGLQIFVKSFL